MRKVCSLGIVAWSLAVALQPAAHAQDAAPTEPIEAGTAAPEAASDKPTISGLFDAYYLYQFNNPPGHTMLTPGRFYYDIRHNTPTVALAELNITKPAAPSRLGYKLSFGAGDIAELNHGGGPNEAGTDIVGTDSPEGRFKNVMQAYLSYAAPSGVTVDFGKFATPFGFEVTEATGNYNYSHSVIYNILPFYHLGFRATVPSTNGLTFSGFVTNAMFNTPRAGVNDDNGSKAIMGQVGYTKGPLTTYLTVGGSRDKLNLADNQKTLMTDFWATYTLDPRTTLAFNYDYRKDDGIETSPEQTFSGFAGYARYAVKPNQFATARYSWLKQKVSPEEGPSSTYKPSEFTLTYEYRITPAYTTRVEYRHDSANADVFAGGDGPAQRDSQDTLLVAAIVSF